MATQWTVANDAIHHCRGYHRDEANRTCINTEVRKAPAKDIIKRDIFHIHMYLLSNSPELLGPGHTICHYYWHQRRGEIMKSDKVL